MALGGLKVSAHAANTRACTDLMRAGTNKSSVSGRPDEVSFTVRQVPDSHGQEGSFKDFQDEGSLMGLVTVEVDTRDAVPDVVSMLMLETPAKKWGRTRVLLGGFAWRRRGMRVAGLRVFWSGAVGWMCFLAQGGGGGVPCVGRLGLFFVWILPRQRGDVFPSGLDLRSSGLVPVLLADA